MVLDKNNVYVPVESKEQAEVYRKVLKAIGEEFDEHLPYISGCISLIFNENWFFGSVKSALVTKSKITFGELVDLLQRKPLLVSMDGVGLFEDSEIHIVSKNPFEWEYECMHKGFKSNDGYWYVNPSAIQPQRKIFSSKQSALDWIESQKPKFKRIEVDFPSLGMTTAVVNKTVVYFDDNVRDLSYESICEIKSIMEELKNG